jgi:hypothetical protein
MPLTFPTSPTNGQTVFSIMTARAWPPTTLLGVQQIWAEFTYIKKAYNLSIYNNILFGE